MYNGRRNSIEERKMARYVTELATTRPPEEVIRQIEQFLLNEGFKQKAHQERRVWKKGMGLMLGPQFVLLMPGEGAVHLEAWIKFALLPGVYLGEMGITGAFALIPKKKLKGRVDQIEAMVS